MLQFSIGMHFKVTCGIKINLNSRCTKGHHLWEKGFIVVFSNICSFVYFISVSWTKIMGKQFIFSLIYLWVVCLPSGFLPTFLPDIILIEYAKLHVTIFLMNDREPIWWILPNSYFLLIVKREYTRCSLKSK